jgi:hypothetical protein
VSCVSRQFASRAEIKPPSKLPRRSSSQLKIHREVSHLPEAVAELTKAAAERLNWHLEILISILI